MIRVLVILYLVALPALAQRHAILSTNGTLAGNGLIHWWPMEDGRVVDLFSVTATVYVATATNFAPSPAGNALDLSQRETWANTGFIWSPGTSDYTMSFWVRLPDNFPNAPNQQHCISATYTNGYGSGVMFQVATYGATNTYDAEWYLSGQAVSAGSLVRGPWYHVAVTRSGNVARCYRNGTHIQSVTSGVFATTQTTGQPLHFGRRWFPNAAGVTNAPAQMDDVRIYDQALSHDAIRWMATGSGQ